MAIELHFYARGNLLVTLPGQAIPAKGGTVLRYVGRDFKRAKMDERGRVTEPAQCPATREGAKFSAESAAGRHLIEEVRKSLRQGCQCLWPADEGTAAACEVPFVDVEFADGEWSEKRAEPKKARARPKE